MHLAYEDVFLLLDWKDWIGRWIVTYIFSILDFDISSVLTQKHIVFPLVFFSCTQGLSWDYREKGNIDKRRNVCHVIRVSEGISVGDLV